MKRKHLVILVVLAAVLVLAASVYQFTSSKTWTAAATDRRVLPDLAVNDVAQIVVKNAGSTLTLKNEQGTWQVAERNGYPADFQKIRELLRTLWELKAGQVTQVGASQHARLRIVRPGAGSDSGTEIDLFSSQGKPLATVILGKTLERGETPGAAGRFVYNPAHPEQVDLVAESFASVDPLTIGSWLDKTFFAADNVKEISRSDPNSPWKLVRADAKSDWRLETAAPNETLNKEVAAGLTSFNPNFTDVRAPGTAAAETGLAQPIEIDLQTFDGFDYKVFLGKEGPEKTRFLHFKVSGHFPEQRLPEPNEKPEDKQKKDEAFQKQLGDLQARLAREQKLEPWIYLVPDYSVEALLKRRDELLSHPSPAPAASPAVPR
jgi:Domain of unknown function (DUF4340)